MIEIVVTDQDIKDAWSPKTEQARMFHCPLNTAIARALSFNTQHDYAKVGANYFATVIGGEYQMWDIVEARISIPWNHKWDNGLGADPIVLHAIKTDSKKPISAAVAAGYKPRRYEKDTETRRLRPDAQVATSTIIEASEQKRTSRKET